MAVASITCGTSHCTENKKARSAYYTEWRKPTEPQLKQMLFPYTDPWDDGEESRRVHDG